MVTRRPGEDTNLTGESVRNLLPAKKKPLGRCDGRQQSNELVQALTVTRYSRLQVLKGLAALGAVAVLPAVLESRPVLAQSSGSTVISGPEANLEAWKTAFLSTYSGRDQVRELLAIRAMSEYRAKNPNATRDNIWWAGDEFRRKYDTEAIKGETPHYRDTKKLLDYVSVGIAVASDLPGLGGVIAEAYDKFLKPAIEEQWEPINRYEAAKAQDAYWAEVRDKKDEILDNALDLRGDAAFAGALDMSYGQDTQVSVADIDKGPTVLVGEVLTLYLSPLPKAKEKLQAAIQQDGTLAISEEELREILKEVLGGLEGRLGALETMMNETLETARRLESQQKDILAWMADKDRQEQERALREAQAQQHQLVIDGARSAVYLVSTLVGLTGNKEFANQISVVGNAAIQVYDAVEKFVDALPELMKLGNLAVGLSGAVMTGNVVGAVMSIVSLFQDQGPDPDQMILDQIGRLQEQVGRLHEQMHERFDRVEKYLDAIYDGINGIFELCQARFNQIANDLDGVRRDVDAIQQELSRQEAHLSRLGQGIHEGLQELSRQDLVEAINGAIGYKSRTGSDMSSKVFGEYENEFYSWAVNHANGANEQPIGGRSYSDDDVLSELEGYPLEENIMYLSNWLQKRAGLPALSTGSLPNPITWAISARAYAELRVENPKHAVTGGYTSRNTTVENEGEKLRTALRKITVTRDTSTGPEPNYQLFETLFTSYRTKLTDLDEALKSVESEFLSDWVTVTINRPAGPDVDPWGGSRQSIDHDPPFPSDAPSGIASFLPAPYRLADYIRLLSGSDLTAEMVPEWIDHRERVVSTRDRVVTSTYAKLKVTATVKYRGTSFLVRHIVGPETLMAQDTWYDNGSEPTTWEQDAQSAYSEQWDSEGGPKLKEAFANDSEETSPATILPDVASRVEDKLRDLRTGLYAHMLRELGDGLSLHPPARRLDGAKALIDRFVNLGMPLAVEYDDSVRAMLYGTQSLIDRWLVQERYADTAQRAPLGHYVSLRSHSQPTRFVRHRDFGGEITEINSDLDKQDSTFKVVPGLFDTGQGAISLESLNYPGYYLAVSPEGSGYIFLSEYDYYEPFRKRATFSVAEGLAGSNGVSLKSIFKNRYLRSDSDYWLIADYDGVDNQYKPDATFHVTVKNPLERIKQDGEARADALYKQDKTGVLASYLDSIGTEEWFEDQPMVRSMLLRSRAISAVVKALNEADPGGTDTTAPEVTSTTPENGAKNVKRGTNVSATFSEKMAPKTLTASTFTLKDTKTGTKVTGASTSLSSDGKTVTLDPPAKLAKKTKYEAKITTEASDKAGNPLATEKVWSFTTGKK